MLSVKHGYPCIREKCNPAFPVFKNHGNDVEMTIGAFSGIFPAGSEESCRGLCDFSSFHRCHTLLRFCLKWSSAAFNFDKMYTIFIDGYNIYFKVPAPPVSCNYAVPVSRQEFASEFFSSSSCSDSIFLIAHVPSLRSISAVLFFRPLSLNLS